MHLPVMWWAAGVPCCSVYIPVFPAAGGIPDCLKRAGTYGKTLCAPSEVRAEDTYQEGSFWWEMRSLLGVVNGDDVGTHYDQRHTVVRTLFDKLEEKWLSKFRIVEKEAAALKHKDQTEEMSELLYRFTEECVEDALAVIEDAKKMFL